MTPILSLSDFKKRFDAELKLSLEEKVSRVHSLTGDAYIHALAAQVEKIVVSGGKRVRPYVAYLMYHTAGGKSEDSYRFFVGLELFHAFALMHDDIIDQAATRHSETTIHEYAKSGLEGSDEQVRHIAEGQAILTGDFLLHWAHEEVERRVPRAFVHDVLEVFHLMVDTVIVGEMLDVKLAAKKSATAAEVHEKTLLKTAYYTFVHPMQLGSVAAGAGETNSSFCESYGAAIGMAFQIRDDLLDIIGDEKKLGKPTFSDLAEGHHTFFTQYIRDHGTEGEKGELNSLFGKPVGSGERARALALFESSGAITEGKKEIERYCNTAEAACDGGSILAEYAAAWRNLVSLVRRY